MCSKGLEKVFKREGDEGDRKRKRERMDGERREQLGEGERGNSWVKERGERGEREGGGGER